MDTPGSVGRCCGVLLYQPSPRTPEHFLRLRCGLGLAQVALRQVGVAAAGGRRAGGGAISCWPSTHGARGVPAVEVGAPSARTSAEWVAAGGSPCQRGHLAGDPVPATSAWRRGTSLPHRAWFTLSVCLAPARRWARLAVLVSAAVMVLSTVASFWLYNARRPGFAPSVQRRGNRAHPVLVRRRRVRAAFQQPPVAHSARRGPQWPGCRRLSRRTRARARRTQGNRNAAGRSRQGAVRLLRRRHGQTTCGPRCRCTSAAHRSVLHRVQRK